MTASLSFNGISTFVNDDEDYSFDFYDVYATKYDKAPGVLKDAWKRLLDTDDYARNLLPAKPKMFMFHTEYTVEGHFDVYVSVVIRTQRILVGCLRSDNRTVYIDRNQKLSESCRTCCVSDNGGIDDNDKDKYEIRMNNVKLHDTVVIYEQADYLGRLSPDMAMYLRKFVDVHPEVAERFGIAHPNQYVRTAMCLSFVDDGIVLEFMLNAPDDNYHTIGFGTFNDYGDFNITYDANAFDIVLAEKK